MAGFLKSNTASLANGSKVIQITGGLNCSFVGSGTAVYINDILLEGISGTAADPSGNSTITLRDTFTGVSVVNGTLTAFNTIEGLRDAIQRARELSAGLNESTTYFGEIITATSPTISIPINGVATEVTPYGYLSQQVQGLVGIADGAADVLLGLQDEVNTLSSTVATIQDNLDLKVSTAGGYADAAGVHAANAAAYEVSALASASSASDSQIASESARDLSLSYRDETLAAKDVVTTSEAVVVAAKNAVVAAETSVLSARDTTLAARDVTLAARDIVTASEVVVVAAEANTLDARDETVLARDLTLGYRDSAATSETNAAASATSASEDAALAQEWAISPNIIGIDQRSSKYWAEFAKENADLTSVSGGIFTPTLALEYPTVGNPTRDTTFLVSFTDPSDSYTFTTGDLLGVTVFSTYIMFWDAGLGEFKLVTSPSGAAILSVNGKTGSSITLTSLDIPHGLGNVSTSLDSKVNNTDIASTTVAGITTLSNSYAGISEDVATTEKALSEGLATKAASVHEHAGEGITSGTVSADRLPQATLSTYGVVTLSNSFIGTSETTAATEKALSDGIGSVAGNLATVATTGQYSDLIGAPDLSNKQDTLVSGVNIKTVSGVSILGSGDITLPTSLSGVSNLGSGAGQVYKETTNSIARLRSIESDDGSIDIGSGLSTVNIRVNASNINLGTMPIDRLPVGTLSTQVARGSHVHTFSDILSKPNTISGYGITDAVSSTTTTTQNITSALIISNNVRVQNSYAVTESTGYVRYSTSSTAMQYSSSGVLFSVPPRPSSDNGVSCGTSSSRWSVIYAASATINTSDERVKTELLDLTDVEKACAQELKGCIKKFKYKGAVSLKGESARIHFGVGVQTVIAVFNKHGLNPFSYGVVCHDQWDDILDEESGEVKTEAGDIYGIRYEELLCFIIASI